MQFISSTLGQQLRPRLACELRPEGIAAASGTVTGALSQTAWEPLPEGALLPGIHSGNIADSPRLTTAVNSALGRVSSGTRTVTLIVPDICVRVLLIDFDSLPTKQSEALPVVSFRLKKLLPFEVEHAAVSYQILSSTKSQVRVLAVAIQRDLLAELESAVRAAGYEPGAVLPSTLAALAAVEDSSTPTLLVNTTVYGLTTAIVHNGELKLHRTSNFAIAPAVSEDSTASENTIATAIQTDAAREVEILQTVNIVSAWSEDTLGVYPGTAYAAGSRSAADLQQIFSGAAGFHEIVESSSMLAEAATTNIARHWLAGVAGALKTA